MMIAVWTDTAVTDNALTRAVAQIRKALDNDPKEPRYVETICRFH
jgi:DNA-binding winged helix-turn-helix (wHTH) protein